MEDVNKSILFLFLSLDKVTWNSSSGGFAHIWQSKWVGIIAIKTERTQIHFLSDVLVAVASLDLKGPNSWPVRPQLRSQNQLRETFRLQFFLVCKWRMCIILQIVLSLIQKLLNILIAYVALSSRTKIFKGQLKSPRSFTQRTRIISTAQSQTITLMKPLENSSAASRHSALSRSGYRSAGYTRLRVIFGVLYQM